MAAKDNQSAGARAAAMTADLAHIRAAMKDTAVTFLTADQKDAITGCARALRLSADEVLDKIEADLRKLNSRDAVKLSKQVEAIILDWLKKIEAEPELQAAQETEFERLQAERAKKKEEREQRLAEAQRLLDEAAAKLKEAVDVAKLVSTEANRHVIETASKGLDAAWYTYNRSAEDAEDGLEASQAALLGYDAKLEKAAKSLSKKLQQALEERIQAEKDKALKTLLRDCKELLAEAETQLIRAGRAKFRELK